MSIILTLIAAFLEVVAFVARNAWVVFPVLVAVWILCLIAELRPTSITAVIHRLRTNTAAAAQATGRTSAGLTRTTRHLSVQSTR